MKIPAMRATLGLIVLAACGVAKARAQATPDTGVVVRGFLQHDSNGGWTIVVPESFEAGGVRTFVLQLQGKASPWSPLLDRYFEARGRVPLGRGAGPGCLGTRVAVDKRVQLRVQAPSEPFR